MKKRIRMLLPILVILAMLVSQFGVALPVMANRGATATPPGSDTNNVQMSITGIPAAQKEGGNIDFYIVVTNPQLPLYPALQSADAQNMTVTFYPSQADGTPSPSGTVIGTIPYLAVNGTPVEFGPFPYAMPDLDPGITVAIYRAVLTGTILLAPSCLSISRNWKV